ncbi:MAG: DUF1501 domain-containing protein, partial [Planctomycetota bacterium]
MGSSAEWLDRPLARREALSGIARAALGVSVGSWLGGSFPGNIVAAEELASGKKQDRSKNIITLFMRGAMSHIDTFDPKPGRPEQGETG